MLLKDLKKNTWKGHADEETIAQALEEMENLGADVERYESME